MNIKQINPLRILYSQSEIEKNVRVHFDIQIQMGEDNRCVQELVIEKKTNQTDNTVFSRPILSTQPNTKG